MSSVWSKCFPLVLEGNSGSCGWTPSAISPGRTSRQRPSRCIRCQILSSFGAGTRNSAGLVRCGSGRYIVFLSCSFHFILFHDYYRMYIHDRWITESTVAIGTYHFPRCGQTTDEELALAVWNQRSGPLRRVNTMAFLAKHILLLGQNNPSSVLAFACLLQGGTRQRSGSETTEEHPKSLETR